MRKLLFAGVMVLALPNWSAASACVPDTLANYILLSSTGCEVGAATFKEFAASSLLFGATPISTGDVTVAPMLSGVGLDFTTRLTARDSDLLDILIRFSVTGGAFGWNALSMSGAFATDNGVVTGIEDKCVGGTFAGSDPSGACSGTPVTLVVAQTATTLDPPDTESFPISSFFDVFVELTLDGGSAGTAGFDQNGFLRSEFAATDPAAIPEPASILLVAGGLIGFVLRRRQKH